MVRTKPNTVANDMIETAEASVFSKQHRKLQLSGLQALCSERENHELPAAWRLPFLLSIPLTFFIIAMRRAIHDFPVPSTKLEGRSIATSCAVLKKPMLTAVSIMSFATVFG